MENFEEIAGFNLRRAKLIDSEGIVPLERKVVLSREHVTALANDFSEYLNNEKGEHHHVDENQLSVFSSLFHIIPRSLYNPSVQISIPLNSFYNLRLDSFGSGPIRIERTKICDDDPELLKRYLSQLREKY